MSRQFFGSKVGNRKKLVLALTVGLIVALLLCSCSNTGHNEPTATAKSFKAAFVYVGPTDDMGWSYAHDQGRLYLQNELGVQTAFSEVVSGGAEATHIITDYAEKGYDVIFATSFDYLDSVMQVASEYPEVIFEQCTGDRTATNVGIYDGRGYQGWYLAGIVAGSMTRNNMLGYVAPFPIPEVVRNMNAFTLGARSVNPAVEVHPAWIYTWVDPPKEREAAQRLVDLGADVVARESDSAEPDKVAQENGVFAIGYNAYQPDVAPNALLTAPVWNWGVFYKKQVEDMMNGTWRNSSVWWGLKEGVLDMAPMANFVPGEVKALVESKKRDIMNGVFDVFAGPIRDNTGALRVSEGTTMTDAEKLSFNWLVDGVVGSIGAPNQVSVEVSYDEFQAALATTGGTVAKAIEVPSGDSIVVRLWSNRTTGYSWSELAAIGDPSVLQQADHKYVAPEAKGLVGAAGTEVWTFRTMKAGVSQLSMKYGQPWEGGQKDVFGFSLMVTVK